ncbi:Hypothetical protein POVN_LOCUS240 [uncultured virus]|nr:Hypothetical protein POVN_LOCUS240 [uncultured virus]
MTTEAKLFHEFKTSIVCWSYHAPTRLLVMCAANDLVWVGQLKPDSTEVLHEYSFFLAEKGQRETISVDFDLYEVKAGVVRMALSNYDSASHIIDVHLPEPKAEGAITVTRRPIPFGGNYGLIFNRTIPTDKYIILIGEDLRIYNSTLPEGKDPALLAKFEADYLGVESFKVGELDGDTLYVSSHEGKLFRIDLTPKVGKSGKQLKPKAKLVEGVYADAFKLFHGFLIASNHKAHTVTVSTLAAPEKVLATYDVIAADMKAEYPYPSIGASAEYVTFPATPTVTAFLRLEEGKLVRHDYEVPSTPAPLFINKGLLTAYFKTPPAGVTVSEIPELNCYTDVRLYPF